MRHDLQLPEPTLTIEERWEADTADLGPAPARDENLSWARIHNEAAAEYGRLVHKLQEVNPEIEVELGALKVLSTGRVSGYVNMKIPLDFVRTLVRAVEEKL